MLDQEDKRALAKLAEGQNLVPFRRLYAMRLTASEAATEARLSRRVQRGPHTKAYALRVIAPPTLEGEDDALVYFAINSQRTAQNEFASLATGEGDHLQPGAKHEHTFPAWMDEWAVDVCGLEASDQTSRIGVTVTIEVWELVSAEYERCSR